jgi:hypothetical protein
MVRNLVNRLTSALGHKQTFFMPAQNVRLYKALAVKVVLIRIAGRSPSMVMSLSFKRVLR